MHLLPRFGLGWIAFGLLLATGGSASARDAYWRSSFPTRPPAWVEPRPVTLALPPSGGPGGAKAELKLNVLGGFAVSIADAAPFADLAAAPLLDAQVDDDGRWRLLRWNRAAPSGPASSSGPAPGAAADRKASSTPLGPGPARLETWLDRDGDGRFETSQVVVASLPADCRFRVDDGWLFVASAVRVCGGRLAADGAIGPWETLLVRTEDAPKPLPPLLGRTPWDELSVVFRGTSNVWKGRDGKLLRRFDSAAAAVCSIDGNNLEETSWGYCRPISAPWFDVDGRSWMLERRSVREAPGQRTFLQEPKAGRDAGWRWRAHAEAPTGDTHRTPEDEPFPPLSPPPAAVGELGLSTCGIPYEGRALPAALRGSLLVNDLPSRSVSFWLRSSPASAGGMFPPDALAEDFDGVMLLDDVDFMAEAVPFQPLPFDDVAKLVESLDPDWAPVRTVVGPDQRIYVALARVSDAALPLELGEFPATVMLRFDWTGLKGVGPATPPRDAAAVPLKKHLEKASPARLWALTDVAEAPLRQAAVRELARRTDLLPSVYEPWLENPLLPERRLHALAEVCWRRGKADGWPMLMKLADDRHPGPLRKKALQAALRLLAVLPPGAISSDDAATAFALQRGVFVESFFAGERLRLLSALLRHVEPRRREGLEKDLHEVTVEALFELVAWNDFGDREPPMPELLRAAGPAVPAIVQRCREQAAAGQDEDWGPYQSLLAALPPAESLAEFDVLLPTLEANRGNEGVLVELLQVHSRKLLDFGGTSAAVDAWLKRSSSLLRPNNAPADQSLMLVGRGDEIGLKTIWKYVERQRGLRRTYAYAAVANARRTELALPLAKELEAKRAMAVPGGPARMLLALSALRPLTSKPARDAAAAVLRNRWKSGADDQAEWTLLLSSLYDATPAEAEAAALREWEQALQPPAPKPENVAAPADASTAAAQRPSQARLSAALRVLAASKAGALRAAEDFSSASPAAARLPRELGPYLLQALALHAETVPDGTIAELQQRVERRLSAAAPPRPSVKDTFASCAACHSWNPEREALSWGPLLPPPLLPTVAEWNRSVAAPAATVPAESRGWRLSLRDGRTFLGWPMYDSDQEFVLVQADGFHLHFHPAEVLSCLPSRTSGMPPLLSAPLADDLERFVELLQRTVDQAGGAFTMEDDEDE